jgi:hypothetical protein
MGEELQKLDINVGIRRLSFSKYRPYVETDRGFLRIQSTHSSILPSQSKPILWRDRVCPVAVHDRQDSRQVSVGSAKGAWPE